jgi:Mg2+ and Co2+ transporter CorA
MCIPMTVIAETFGMNLTELGEQTWYWKGEKDE